MFTFNFLEIACAASLSLAFSHVLLLSQTPGHVPWLGLNQTFWFLVDTQPLSHTGQAFTHYYICSEQPISVLFSGPTPNLVPYTIQNIKKYLWSKWRSEDYTVVRLGYWSSLSSVLFHPSPCCLWWKCPALHLSPKGQTLSNNLVQFSTYRLPIIKMFNSFMLVKI